MFGSGTVKPRPTREYRREARGCWGIVWGLSKRTHKLGLDLAMSFTGTRTSSSISSVRSPSRIRAPTKLGGG